MRNQDRDLDMKAVQQERDAVMQEKKYQIDLANLEINQAGAKLSKEHVEALTKQIYHKMDQEYNKSEKMIIDALDTYSDKTDPSNPDQVSWYKGRVGAMIENSKVAKDLAIQKGMYKEGVGVILPDKEPIGTLPEKSKDWPIELQLSRPKEYEAVTKKEYEEDKAKARERAEVVSGREDEVWEHTKEVWAKPPSTVYDDIAKKLTGDAGEAKVNYERIVNELNSDNPVLLPEDVEALGGKIYGLDLRWRKDKSLLTQDEFNQYNAEARKKIIIHNLEILKDTYERKFKSNIKVIEEYAPEKQKEKVNQATKPVSWTPTVSPNETKNFGKGLGW